MRGGVEVFRGPQEPEETHDAEVAGVAVGGTVELVVGVEGVVQLA